MNVGAFYFSLGADPTTPQQWTTPQNAANAPDGNYAFINAQILSFTNRLWMTQWLGKQYLPPIVNLVTALVEVYGFYDPSVPIGTVVQFNFNFVYNNALIGSITSGTIALTNTLSWQPLIRTSGQSFAYNGPIDSTFGVAFQVDYASGTFGNAPLYIDSVRMTVSYNDDFYDPGYGFVRNKRRYIGRKGKALAEVKTR